MTSLLHDLAYAARTFRRQPAFAWTAVATLALGIGATAAIFSVVNAVLLRPLPYDEPDRLVHIWQDMRNRSVSDFPWPPADFHDLRERTEAFDGVAALVTGRQVIVGEDGETEQFRTGGATPNLFTLLGTRVAMGRDFTETDGTPLPPNAPGAAAAPYAPEKAILSHEFWLRRFGGNRDIVGTVVKLAEQRFEIVGVLEPGFELLFPPGINIERFPELWTPLRLDFAAGSRVNVFLRVVGRLKPGVSQTQAQAEVDAIAADLRSRFPIKQTAGVHLRIERMHGDLVADVRPSIVALMGAVSFVLLIACANVANLLLVRAAAREREFAVRAALGSTRWRLIRQTLADSLLLAGAAIVAGIVLAWVGVRLLLALGPENLPRLDGVAVDPSVITFAAGAGLLSSVLFGLFPSLRASRPDVMDLLRRGGRMGTLSSGSRARSAVVTLEVALSFVLLVGSGLMMRSFAALQRADPGFDANGVLTLFIPNLRLPDGPARQAFVRDFRARLESLPGAQGATAATPFPLDGRDATARWGTEAALTDPTKFQQATFHVVVPGYFEVMRTKVLEGRTFTEADDRPESRAVIVDRVLAARAFPGQSAVGRTLLARVRTQEPERFEIVGVVEQQRHRTLARNDREALFLTDGMMSHGVANRWAIRTSGNPLELVTSVRSALRELNPRAGAIDIQPMQAFVARAQAQTRFALVLIAIFAGVALLLAAVGLYSVLSTLVRQRTAEIGVRMAFGAGQASIFRLMVGHGLRLSLVGLAWGVAAALALTGMMRSMLVGIEPTDPATFTVVIAGFLTIAALACGLPALRAARMDPMAALGDH